MVASSNNKSTSSNASNSKSSYLSLNSLLSHAAIALIAYQLGITTQAHHIATQQYTSNGQHNNDLLNFKQQQQPRKIKEEVVKQEDSDSECNCICDSNNEDEEDIKELGIVPPEEDEEEENEHAKLNNNNNNNERMFRFDSAESHASSIRSLFRGAARVSRQQFISEYDLGVPWDEPVKYAEDVIVFYSSNKAFPKSYVTKLKNSSEPGWPKVQYNSDDDNNAVIEATSNCDIMKVILIKPNQKVNECVAIVPQWESYHVHKFMRWKDDKDLNNKRIVPVSNTYKLKHVSRHHEKKGTTPRIPNQKQVQRYLPMLTDYINKYDHTIQRLKPIIDEMMNNKSNNNSHNNKAVVVMVCNFGQSELFLNFVCSAKSKQMDLSRILLFATDSDMYDLAVTMAPDIKVFNVDDAFGENIPKIAARVYGDRAFTGMMFSKLYCVHLVNSLGYDVLFQDVDVVWYKNPIDYFTNTTQSGSFDFYFQDDGARSNRYVPYSPNSGFYYVRNNERTKHFFSIFMRTADQIIVTASHQAALNDLLTDHSSTTGLRVKVFARDSPIGLQFPGGYHYHYRRSFMKDMIDGKQQPFLFHMSWTKNKDNKKNFYEQMGDWYVHEQCYSKTVTQIPNLQGTTNFVRTCCSTEPIMVCHYSDKPSKSSTCKTSPKIDTYGKPFWK